MTPSEEEVERIAAGLSREQCDARGVRVTLGDPSRFWMALCDGKPMAECLKLGKATPLGRAVAAKLKETER